MLVVLCFDSGPETEATGRGGPWKRCSDIDVLVTSGAPNYGVGDPSFPGFIIPFHKS